MPLNIEAVPAGEERSATPDREAWIQALREQVARCEGGRRRETESTVSTGCAAVDRLLPAGGLRRGTLVEWLQEAPGNGAGWLALLAAREACRGGGLFVVLDRARQFYPPAVVPWGIALSQIVVLRAASAADELWGADQALRCPGVAAVWLPRAQLAAQDFRRLQLAAEQGSTLGLLLRPSRVVGQPTWADVQWLVQPHPAPLGAGRRVALELTRCRGGPAGQSLILEFDDRSGTLTEARGGHETPALSGTPALASPTAPRRATGA